MKRKEKKGVATSLFLSATCWPLASLVSRRHVSSVCTCPPLPSLSQRTHTDHKLRPWCSLFPSPAWAQTTTCALGVSYFLLQHGHRPQPVPLAFLSTPFTHTGTLLAPPPSGTAHPTLRQSGQRHASFPRHRDRWVFTPGEIAAVCFFCTQPP